MDDLKPWERQPGETARAYECFCVFRDAGPSRVLVDVYRQVTGRFKARDPAGVWGAWCKNNDWWERAELYDAHLERKRLEDRAEADRQAHLEAISEYRKAHLAVARATFGNSGEALNLLKKFLQSQPKIKDWDEATKAIRVIAFKEASEVWASALGIDVLMEQLRDDQP